MTSSLRPVSALVCALLLLLSACDDPSSVGGEIVGEGGGAPQGETIVLDVAAEQYDVTNGSPAIDGARVLAGRTENDPLGDVTATGYVDFGRAASGVDFPSRTVDSVSLELTPTYSYGDTTQAARFALYDLTGEFSPSDTSLGDLAEASPITTFEVAARDTLVTVDLPRAWVRDHADELTAVSEDSTVSDAEAFGEAFHGFQIRPEDARSVEGFDVSTSSLRVTLLPQGEQSVSTLNYPIQRQSSAVRQPDPEVPGDERFVVQAGIGRGLQFTIPASAYDSLRNVVINSARLVVEVDSVSPAFPDGFARPRIQSLNLYQGDLTEADSLGLVPGTSAGALATLSAGASGTRLDEANFPLGTILEDLFRSDENRQRFALRPVRQVVAGNNQLQTLTFASLNSALIRNDAGHRPRLELVYTSTAQD